MKVLIVHDRVSKTPSKDEEDTLLEVEQVSKVLQEKGDIVTSVEFSLNLADFGEYIAEFCPDVIFNLVETLEGSRLLYLAPVLFESLHLPYTGGNSQGMFLSSDKLLAKELLLGASIPTPRWFSFRKRQKDPLDLEVLVDLPLIAKPISEEASVGINDDSILTFSSSKAIEQFLCTHDFEGLFLEEFIEGREFNISVLCVEGEPKVLPPAEIVFDDYPLGKPEIVGYEAKWDADSFAYSHTRRTFDFPLSDKQLLERLESITLQCWNLFGAKGYSRVDFRVDRQGNPYVLEVNVNPCISDDSGFTAACERSGMTYDGMIDRIIQE
ncbi:ATP-grasp domain-containing protein [uncultured Sphaerochaeta sp.]|uniref:D-alanine--D-alanine ligase family protein n=1 Tax=uncultured Sphaerochaeta sp. TaxID=886478 RepID=UPI002A0A6E0B|nr:ATP-grasp domain-containing protein [uncultured Sphaerochaeta sp.]